MPNYRAVNVSGEILKKGYILAGRDENWTFQSVTHPRKVHVTAKDDPNGPDSWPNMASREFYPNVFELGIWDVDSKAWSFQPSWDEKRTQEVADMMLKSDKSDEQEKSDKEYKAELDVLIRSMRENLVLSQQAHAKYDEAFKYGESDNTEKYAQIYLDRQFVANQMEKLLREKLGL